jgi:hypothetical protein
MFQKYVKLWISFFFQQVEHAYESKKGGGANNTKGEVSFRSILFFRAFRYNVGTSLGL